jgi:hypothetical protein
MKNPVNFERVPRDEQQLYASTFGGNDVDTAR